MKKTLMAITCGIIIFLIIGAIIASNLDEKINIPNQETNPDISGKSNKNQSKSLIGTWIKYKIQQEGHVFPGDKNWQLTVTFDSDGRFTWNSKRKDKSGKTIDESLTGTYTLERGFLVSYHFDKPSNQALIWLPEFFAFWPNQLLGRHTFGFGDDYLCLGNDGHKTWIYLKRNDSNI